MDIKLFYGQWKINILHFPLYEVIFLSDIVDELIDQCMTGGNEKEQVVLTFGHAKNLVQHFQRLFDCPQIIGVYSRMNVVYSRYSEMQNILDSLKKILNIGSWSFILELYKIWVYHLWCADFCRIVILGDLLPLKYDPIRSTYLSDKVPLQIMFLDTLTLQEYHIKKFTW